LDIGAVSDGIGCQRQLRFGEVDLPGFVESCPLPVYATADPKKGRLSHTQYKVVKTAGNLILTFGCSPQVGGT